MDMKAATQPVKTYSPKQVKRHALMKNIWNHKLMYLLLIPGIIYVFLFRYVPMYGITLAFKDINLSEGLYGGVWVGFKYFNRIFDSTMFVNALRNTIIINLLKMLTHLVIPVAIALFMNEITREWYKRTLQTAIYMPRFVSWVVYGGIVTLMLSPESGVVNALVKLLGGTPIFFLSKPEYFKAILIISDMMKEAGWSAVVYIAAISTVDIQQYEAALMDGAFKLQRIRHITLPGIATTIIIMFTLRVGSMMSAGLDQVFNLYNPIVFETGDVLDTLTYRLGIEQGDISLGTAAGVFQSTIGFVLVLISDWFAKRMNNTSLF